MALDYQAISMPSAAPNFSFHQYLPTRTSPWPHEKACGQVAVKCRSPQSFRRFVTAAQPCGYPFGKRILRIPLQLIWQTLQWRQTTTNVRSDRKLRIISKIDYKQSSSSSVNRLWRRIAEHFGKTSEHRSNRVSYDVPTYRVARHVRWCTYILEPTHRGINVRDARKITALYVHKDSKSQLVIRGDGKLPDQIPIVKVFSVTSLD